MAAAAAETSLLTKVRDLQQTIRDANAQQRSERGSFYKKVSQLLRTVRNSDSQHHAMAVSAAETDQQLLSLQHQSLEHATAAFENEVQQKALLIGQIEEQSCRIQNLENALEELAAEVVVFRADLGPPLCPVCLGGLLAGKRACHCDAMLRPSLPLGVPGQATPSPQRSVSMPEMS